MNKKAVVTWAIILGIVLLLFGLIRWWIQSSVSVDPLTTGQIRLFVGLILFGIATIIIGAIER